jgi:hypothetical protein
VCSHSGLPKVLGAMIDATLARSAGAERDKLRACIALLLDGLDT